MAKEFVVEKAVAKLISGEEVAIPYWRIESGKDGPAFMILSAQHGNEVNGSEAIRRFVEEIKKSGLKRGRVFAVPFANILAVHKRRPHISLGPEEPYADAKGHNMNRTWPGNKDGNDTQRLSYALYERIAKYATYVLDFHSWERHSATAAIARKDSPGSMEMARVSAIRFIQIRTRPAEESKKSDPRGTIAGLFNDTGKAGLTIELAGQYAVVEHEVRRGLRAALNIVRLLGMLEGEPLGLDEPMIFSYEAEEAAVKAPISGLFVEKDFATWDYVEKGRILGHLLSDETLETVELASPASGYLRTYGVKRANADVALPSQHPYTKEGELLATIAAGKATA